MKTWLITGCSSGIGEGIAYAVLKKGDNAVITARNIEKIKHFEEEYPNNSLILKLDVTNENDIDSVYQKGMERFGTIDVLVNNAGYGYRAAVEESEFEETIELFKTNFIGPAKLMNKVLPLFRKNRNGAIINVSSIGAIRAAIGNSYYSASKSALELISDGLYKEVKNLGIKVMIVEPGAFRTNFYDKNSIKGTNIKIDDYKDTAGKVHVENMVNNHNQLGNPMKAGEVIVDVIEKEDYPEHLILGSDSYKMAKQEFENRLSEIEKWKEYSFKTDYMEDDE